MIIKSFFSPLITRSVSDSLDRLFDWLLNLNHISVLYNLVDLIWDVRAE